jgi:N-acetylneuraminate synthase
MTLIIAEAGVNHNGDKQLALKLIDEAKYAGVDIVKFQTFKASHLVTDKAKKAEYQVNDNQSDDTQLNMLKGLELSEDVFIELSEYCRNQGIEFLSTAFDSQSLSFLVNKIKLKRLKIPSGELTNLPFILEHAKTKLDIIVSTGMANLSEIEQALGVIAFGYISNKDDIPSLDGFYEAYSSEEGQAALKEKVTILHCTTEYPAPFDEINLNAINTLNQTFKLKTGYSDHSKGIVISIAAVAKGACLIEKHFTLDQNMVGPDHQASLEPSELKDMVQAIRDTEKALGDGVKRPFPSEVKNKTAARKSLVANVDIKKGTILTQENIGILRPGSGMSPNLYWDVLGVCARQDYQQGELIDE